MRIALIFVIAALLLHPVTGVAGAVEVYEQMKLLAGEWEAELPGFGKLTSSVRVVSNGKAIEETLGTPSDNEISVYTLNGNTILLTHYCAMTPDGHQVRLQTLRLGAAPHQLDFRFASATNLNNRTAAHMKRVSMIISDHDHYSEKWTKTENGKETEFDLRFARR
jgi:hypothetical protein